MVIKRVLSTMLAAVLVFCMLPAAALAADDNGDGYNDHDAAQIAAFLAQDNGAGITNAQALGCDAADPSTWTGITWTADAEKRAQNITWENSGIGGALSLSDCTALQTVEADGNALKSLDITGSPVTALSCGLNPLTHISADINGANVALNSNGDGYIWLSYGAGVLNVMAIDDEGSAFSGWTGTEGGAQYSSTNNMITLTPGTEYDLTCIFLYCVVYDDNGSDGGSVPAFSTPYSAGSTVTVLGNTGSLTRTGYDFAGWNTEADGSGTHYDEDDTFEMTDSAFTLYAEWEPVIYTITYVLDGGAVEGVNPGTYTIESPAITLINPAKEGYTFDGWSGDDIVGTSTSVTIPTGSAGNRTYTANWSLAEYFITYNANGATTGTAPAGTGPHNMGDSVTLQNNSGFLAKANHTFTGWNTKPDGTGTHYNAPSTITMPAKDLVFYAEWEDGFNNADVAKIKAFLSQNSAQKGKTNADKLGCEAGDPFSWTGITWRTVGSYKYLRTIGWEDKSLAGSLDLSGCSYLTDVDCSGNYITSLNINNCSALKELNCYDNYLTSLTAGQAPALELLDCSYNNLAALNISQLNNINALDCSYNKLKSLVLNSTNSLQELDCSNNKLASLSISKYGLQYLDCSENNMTSLNLSGCYNLQLLNCSRNKLTSLNTAGFTALQVLDCSYNSLKSLNTAGCTKLAGLDCGNNSITSLNLAANKYLIIFFCNNNALTSLTLSQKLGYFDCTGNRLTYINVSLIMDNGSVMPVTLSASGSGYVGLEYLDAAPVAVATPVSSCSFTKWTKSGKQLSTKASITIASGGAYIANFAYTQGTYLSGVKLSAGTLSPAFSKTKTSYKVTIPDNQSSVTITPQKIAGVLSMTIDGKSVSSATVSLNNGQTKTVKVKVSYGKASKTYTFKVTRAKSSNNNLSALTASAGTFDKPFNPAVTSYTLTLSENTKSVKISAAAAAGKAARVSPASKTVSLSNGQSKTVKITVKAQSGARKTYVIAVKRAPSTSTALKYLKTSSKSYPLTPAFSTGTGNYTITLPVNKNKVTISAKAAGYKASVYFDGAKRSSKKVTLQPGQSQTVHVTVRAQSGAEKVYTITVRRLISADANLKSLKASAPLSPAFSPGALSYTVTLPAKSSGFTVKASASGYGAKVTIDGRSASSKKVKLQPGQSVTIRIVVTAQDARYTKTYTVTVRRP